MNNEQKEWEAEYDSSCQNLIDKEIPFDEEKAGRLKDFIRNLLSQAATAKDAAVNRNTAEWEMEAEAQNLSGYIEGKKEVLTALKAVLGEDLQKLIERLSVCKEDYVVGDAHRTVSAVLGRLSRFIKEQEEL